MSLSASGLIGGKAGPLVHHTTINRPTNNAASTGSSTPVTSGMSSGWINALQEIADYNNAFNLSQVNAMNNFNAAEAQKNRDFQERMSRNSYTYAVEDLKNAGLNPVLAALNGGAATPSGSSASGGKATADDTLGNGLISLMSAMISSNSAMSIAQMQMENQRWLMQNNPNSVYNVINGILSGLGIGDGSAKGLSSKNGINTMLYNLKNNAIDWYGNGPKGYVNKWKTYIK